MATGDTVLASLDDSAAAEILSDGVIEAARAAVVALPMIAFDSFRGSNIKSYPRYAKVTAAALTEGTDGTFTTMTDSQVAVTLGEVGIGIRVSDVVGVTSASADVYARLQAELGKAFADKVEVDILAKSASLTDSVGSTGQALTEDVWLQGIYECEANDIGGRTLVFIGYPKQLHNLSAAIAGTTENNSVVYGRPDMLNRLAPSTPTGYKFTLFGVDCFQSTNVPAINTAADSAGMFMVAGPDCPHLIAVGILNGSLWWARYEGERDASFRGQESWVTGYYGVATVAPERGCRVVSVR